MDLSVKKEKDFYDYLDTLCNLIDLDRDGVIEKERDIVKEILDIVQHIVAKRFQKFQEERLRDIDRKQQRDE